MKHLITALSGLIIGLTASAATFSVDRHLQLNPNLDPMFKKMEVPADLQSDRPTHRRAAAAEGTEEVYFSPAGAPAGAFSYGLPVGYQMGMAFQLDPVFLTTLKNLEITEISYYTGGLMGGSTENPVNTITKATVFITDDLNGDFLYTQDTEAPTTGFTEVAVPLTEAYAVPSTTKKLYIGVYFGINNENIAPLVADQGSHLNDYGGWFGYRANSKAAWTWNNAADQIGAFNVGAVLRSNTFPQNAVSVVLMDGQPAARTGEEFSFSFMIQNQGAQPVESLTIEYGIEGEAVKTESFTLEPSVDFYQLAVGSINDFTASVPTKGSDITLKVTTVNGEPNTSETPTGIYPVVIIENGKEFFQNAVIEEFTSTHCIWCPVGYTAMEKIHEEFTDSKIIPVCVHANVSGTDPMTSSSYSPVFNKYGKGAPSSTINRRYSVYPTYDGLVSMAELINTLPAAAEISGTATLDASTRTLTINTEACFAFDYTDGDDNFILSYGVTEDGVGPYTQQNGYSGESQKVDGNWQEQPSTVKLTYNDVARQLNTYNGVKGSIPAEIKAGETYKYTHSFKLVSAVKDLTKIKVVVYMLNRNSNTVENVCVLRDNGQGYFSGIDTVVAEPDDSTAPVEYYNLQGIRVANPSHGIYIRRQGSQTTKIALQ